MRRIIIFLVVAFVGNQFAVADTNTWSAVTTIKKVLVDYPEPTSPDYVEIIVTANDGKLYRYADVPSATNPYCYEKVKLLLGALMAAQSSGQGITFLTSYNPNSEF